MKKAFSSFCPQCGEYFNPLLASCPHCAIGRKPLPQPGKPLWKVTLGAPVRSRALVAGDLALFTAGSRHGGGCVVAIDRLAGEVRWSVRTKYVVEGSMGVFGKRVLFATVGFLGREAQLHAVWLQDGESCWDVPCLLRGSSRLPMVSIGNTVYLTTEDGSLYGFDLESGNLLIELIAKFPRGKNGLAIYQGRLVIVCEEGMIFELHAHSGKMCTDVALEIGTKVTSPLARAHDSLYFGAAGGKVLAYNLFSRQVSEFTDGLKGVSVVPAVAEDVIYISSQDHLLVKMDLRSKEVIWRCPFAHSVNTTAEIAEGLVFIGVNDGAVHCIDQHQGTQVWDFNVDRISEEHDTCIHCSPIFKDGWVYIGADDGNAYALPWHLGEFSWAAEKMEAEKKLGDAAELLALSASLEMSSLEKKRQTSERAIRLWHLAQFPDRAAYYSASLTEVTPHEAARRFREAAEMLSGARPKLAVTLLRRAIELYDHEDMDSPMNECANQMNKICPTPYISVRLRTFPTTWMEGIDQKVVIEFTNRGNVPAKRIRLRLSGSLSKAEVMATECKQTGENLSNPAKSLLEWILLGTGSLLSGVSCLLEISLVPYGVGTGSLRVEVRYQDEADEEYLNAETKVIEIEKTPPTWNIDGNMGVLVIEDSVGGVPSGLRIKGDVGMIKVKGQ